MQGSEAGILTVNQFYEAMGGNVGKTAIDEQCRTNTLKHFRIGTKIVILASEVTEWPLRLASKSVN